jgi:hypothetical protein
MTIHRRLKRLEALLASKNQGVVEKTYDQVMEEFVTLQLWLRERGYADALMAIEAGETGPEGLAENLRLSADNVRAQREGEDFERALAAKRIPTTVH